MKKYKVNIINKDGLTEADKLGVSSERVDELSRIASLCWRPDRMTFVDLISELSKYCNTANELSLMSFAIGMNIQFDLQVGDIELLKK